MTGWTQYQNRDDKESVHLNIQYKLSNLPNRDKRLKTKSQSDRCLEIESKDLI